ncbi:hypothetical protein CP532_0323, partial [Ophiocordyceps camponoti-leonardi (nom. inval.)]
QPFNSTRTPTPPTPIPFLSPSYPSSSPACLSGSVMAPYPSGLPPGWDSDYDGHRWFYTYRSTGHVQYRFPCAGDEFPHFVDEAAPPPDLAPEERLESKQQLLRRHAAVAVAPRMSATAAQPVSYVWEDSTDDDDDDDYFLQQPGTEIPDNLKPSPASPEPNSDIMLPPLVRVEASPRAFDPLGLVAELPTEDTPMSRVELQPEPVEMADNSVPALAELPARTPLEAKPILPWRPDDKQSQTTFKPRQRPEDGLEPVEGAGRQPTAYLPYVPGLRQWTVEESSSSGARRNSGAPVLRQTSLMMGPKQLPELDPSTVPRVLKIANGNCLPRAPEQANQAQPPAPLDPPPPYRLAEDTPLKPQSQGTVAKVPSVLKPARGKHHHLLSEQRRSLPPEKKADIGCFPRAHAGTHASGRPNRPVSLAPGGSTVSLALAGSGRQQSHPETVVVPAAPSSVAAPAYLPYRGRPIPATGGDGGRTELPATVPNSQAVAGRGPRRNSAFTTREVSPIRSRSESLSSCQPPQTPSPLGSMRRGSSNSSLVPGNGHWTGRQSPALGVQPVARDGVIGPPVPGKIPLQHHASDASFVAELPLQRSDASAGRRRSPPQASGLRPAPATGGQRPRVSVEQAVPRAGMADARQQRLSVQAPAAGWQQQGQERRPSQHPSQHPSWSAPKVSSALSQSPVGGTAMSESQDSQAIFDAHRALFGAGPLRASVQACANEALQGRSLVKAEGKKQANAYTIDTPLAGRFLDAAPRKSLEVTRMEAVSQHTPTQTNSDRDYGAFCELTGDEERTLASDDTGAVNFGHLRPSSQLSEDGGLDTTRSEWRVAKTPLDGESSTALETPRNPFAVASAPLVGTQLFGTTQQLSSAPRGVVVSPTSSRPSPHDVAPPLLTSTDDERVVSSPTQILAPCKEDEVIIPESPTERASRPALSRGPSAHYEPMKKSQERKTSGGGGDQTRRQPSPDSDYDDALLKAERRRRAERKRARAAEEMEKICFARKKRVTTRRSNSHEEPVKSVQATPGDERTTAGPGKRRSGIFENMVFVLSTSDKQRKKMEAQIVRAGGSILDDGFQPLFSHDDDDDDDDDEDEDEDDKDEDGNGNNKGQDRLRPVRPNCGFAALIAESHSRKAKFMQALALGLPCLAQQWVTACVAKGAVTDWEPYLLAAGSSAVLGNAIRSRVLTPFSASTARLADMVARRRRPLAGQSVLGYGAS